FLAAGAGQAAGFAFGFVTQASTARRGRSAGSQAAQTLTARGGGGLMKSAYQIIRRPIITEKGLGVKETESTLVFQVAPNATKTEIREAVQTIFKVKVDSVRTSNFQGKE